MSTDKARGTSSSPFEVVAEHELNGVTPEMMDWWWVNMEKGYPLFEPNEHKSLVWEVAPGTNRHIGAIHVAEESVGGGPVMKLRIRWDDPKDSPIAVVYEHAIFGTVLGPNDEPAAMFLHQYEGTPSGVRMRSTFRLPALAPAALGEACLRHDKNEAVSLERFLPAFYGLWQVVADPAINRRCSCKVRPS